jgi:hypothetical protein
MSHTLLSPYSNAGTSAQQRTLQAVQYGTAPSKSAQARTTKQHAVQYSAVEHKSSRVGRDASVDNASQISLQGENSLFVQLPLQPTEETAATADQSVTDLAMRRLSRELEQARQELKELEKTLIQELFMPSVRGWLLPLMAIGLALSLYGSFSSANSAELGATGLMLLWSLSAFWFIYTRERRLEMAHRANKAEMEIWAGRIEELQHSLDRNQRVVERADE